MLSIIKFWFVLKMVDVKNAIVFIKLILIWIYFVQKVNPMGNLIIIPKIKVKFSELKKPNFSKYRSF